MMIPAGILDREKLTDMNYYVEEVVADAVRRPLRRKVAASVRITMKLNSGGASMVVMDGEGTTAFPFPFADRTTLNLTFDNDCGEECKTLNDFSLYYDWLKDTDYPNRRFTAGKDTQLKGRQGNCDPVVVEPPPS
jgi:hypothetical protein